MHTGSGGGPVQSITAAMTAQEAMEAYQALLRAETVITFEDEDRRVKAKE